MSEDVIGELISRVTPYLRPLGLSKSELRAYAVLLTKGPMTAKDLAKSLNVSQVKVYPLLNELIKKGWVKREEGRPTRYVAVPLLEVWHALKSSVIKKLDDIERDIILPLNALFGSKPTAGTVAILSGSSLIDALIALIVRDSREIKMSIAHKELTDDRVLSALTEASKRVAVKALVKEGLEVDLPPRVEVKKKEDLFGSGVITDNSVLLIVKSGSILNGIASNHEYFVNIANVYFDHLWGSA